MTVPATPRRAGPFDGNGVTTSFPFSFKTFDEADIAVVFVDADGIETPLVLSSDYSVTLNPDQEVAPGGAVTYPVSGTPLALGETLSIVGALPYDQVTDLPTGGSYRAQVVENTFDRVEMQIQQLAEIADRTLTLPASVDPDTVSSMLPAPEAFNVIGWNETETALQNFDPTTFATIVAFGTARVDLFSGDGVQTVFVLTANPGVQANLDVAVDGITQRPGLDFVWSAGTTITFTSPPGAGTNNVLARYQQGLPTEDSALRIDLADATLGDALLAVKSTRTGAVATTQHEVNQRTVSVFDYMSAAMKADVSAGTLLVDCTSAFNAATRATVAWSSALEYNIEVPAGKYKINGTVYIRKGQTLRGTGHGTFFDLTGNTTANSFVLGKGFIAGVATDDAGGSPVKAENFWTNGGAANFGAISTNAAGFEIGSVFMTFPGIGLELSGADGMISNLEVDQSLSAVVLTGAQNIVFTNFNVYLPSTALTFNSNCRDIVFNGGIVEYATSTAVLFATGTSNTKGISFNAVNFTLNAQNAGTFQGFVQCRATAVEAQFTGCSFRNMYKWAINHQTNGPVALTFSGCVFDGSPTTTAYTASTTAMVLNTGLNGTYSFQGCEYRNLFGEIVTINDSLTRLVMEGGVVVNCDANAASQKRFNVVTTQYQKQITVKGVMGFAYKSNDAGNQFVVLPWWTGSTQWKVSVKGNTFAPGSNTYSRAEDGMASVSTAYNGATIVNYCDYTQLWKTPTRAIPADIALAACFGTAPGGAVTQAPVASGTICVSSPTPVGNALGFDFYVETNT